MVIDHTDAISGVLADGHYRIYASMSNSTPGTLSGGGYRVHGGFLVASAALNDRLFADGSED